MITYQSHTLSNGLRVLVHTDDATQLATLNILYKVGSRNEDPDRTGFAHLFEHLMFGGSENIANYDQVAQAIGAKNNAFTNTDITNYYITLPYNNLEAAFWLEADRMHQLAFSEKSLEVQQQVVIEEFKQRYLNQPYGDAWLQLRDLVYQVHPYKWATIGKEIAHIEQATLADVKAFFYKYYRPNNAILVVSGRVDAKEVFALSEKWFGDIPKGDELQLDLPQEPQQTAKREKHLYAQVPQKQFYKAFLMPAKKDDAYYYTDLVSDVLSKGDSSRLYRSLVKEKQLLTQVSAFITGEIDQGMFVIVGSLPDNVSYEAVEEALWYELNQLVEHGLTQAELDKVKRQFESAWIFSLTNHLNKALTLAYQEMVSGAHTLETMLNTYRNATTEQVQLAAAYLFKQEKSNTIYYHPSANNVQ